MPLSAGYAMGCHTPEGDVTVGPTSYDFFDGQSRKELDVVNTGNPAELV